MKLCLNYGDAVVVLPRKLLSHMDKAGKKELRVLLALTGDPLAALDLDAAMKNAAASLSMSEREVEAALSFWRGTGLVSVVEGGSAVAVNAAAAPKTVVVSDNGLPGYSTEELSGVLERRKDVSALIDECQRTFGKVFNTKEVSIIVGLTDYLGLTGDYILLLLSHCVRMEKKSLRYLEKTAISLHDEGVHDTAELEARLSRTELMASATGRIRAMFGLSSRALTTKEKNMVEKWVCGMQFGDDVLKMAYEITVDSIGKASMPYANTILERWHAEGYRTVQDVEKALAEYKRKKSAKGSSFDVDDFFEAALKRTYGE